MSHANLGRDLLDRAAEMLTEHGVIERAPLLEGRNMFIVMAPHEKRVEKKSETIGDAMAAQGIATTAVLDAEAPPEEIEPQQDDSQPTEQT